MQVVLFAGSFARSPPSNLAPMPLSQCHKAECTAYEEGSCNCIACEPDFRPIEGDCVPVSLPPHCLTCGHLSMALTHPRLAPPHQ